MASVFAQQQISAGRSEVPRRRHLVRHVATEELADGRVQWPQTHQLIDERLGPTALVIAEENVAALRERLSAAGIILAGL